MAASTVYRDTCQAFNEVFSLYGKGQRNMGPVELAIRGTVHEGDRLATPVRAQPFWVAKISDDGIVLELGEKRTPTRFSWACIEGVLPFLKRRGRVPINGSGKSQDIVDGTLDGYLKQHVNRLTAGWVAALLEKAGIVTIDRTPKKSFVQI